MNLKSKTFQIITRVLCGIFLILAIVLGVIAAACSIGGGVPNIFGANIYIVKTDAFELKNGTALFAYHVPPSEIQPGNFVIINLENNKLYLMGSTQVIPIQYKTNEPQQLPRPIPVYIPLLFVKLNKSSNIKK